MALPASLQPIYDRLKTFYNGSAYSPSTNPGGFAKGGNQVGVFVACLRDLADFGSGIADLWAGVKADADRFEAAVEAIEAGPVTSVNGMQGAVVIPAMAAVLPPVVTAPAAGSTAALVGGALGLAVDGFRPLYPKTQKSIQFQVAASASGFGSPLYDSGAVAGAALSAAVANAQAQFTANTTYYVRARQTDQDDFTSNWSAVTSFVFPRLPAAPVMSAPANNATGVGAQNQPVTLTASAYSHPGGVAQAARRFELSKDNFATIVTVNGAVGQTSATLSNPQGSLTANTAYKVRCVDTDTNGGAATGAATSFMTVATYAPNVGDASNGGFNVGTQTRSGTLMRVIVASKSVGEQNPAASYSSGVAFCDALVTGGYSDWVAPDDQAADLLFANLAPATATAAAFATGGAEAFTTAVPYWLITSSGRYISMSDGLKSTGNPANSNYAVRAVRYVPA